MIDNEKRRTHRRQHISCAVLSDNSRRKLDDRTCRDSVRAEWPCLVPVAPGIMAPSGVLMVGAALVLRDLVQRRLGVEFGIGAIVVGAMISAGLAPASLVHCLDGRVSAFRICRLRGLYPACATAAGGCGGRVQCCRARGRLDRISLACIWLDGISPRSNRG